MKKRVKKKDREKKGIGELYVFQNISHIKSSDLPYMTSMNLVGQLWSAPPPGRSSNIPVVSPCPHTGRGCTQTHGPRTHSLQQQGYVRLQTVL